MAKPSPNEPCPCGAEAKYKRCCGVYHQGKLAPTAESLMRSRYAAYAVGAADYILATTHPASRHYFSDRDLWRDSVRQFCQETEFRGLTVLWARESGNRAQVSFKAQLRQGEQDHVLSELSRFERLDGRWLYLDGEDVP